MNNRKKIYLFYYLLKPLVQLEFKEIKHLKKVTGGGNLIFSKSPFPKFFQKRYSE